MPRRSIIGVSLSLNAAERRVGEGPSAPSSECSGSGAGALSTHHADAAFRQGAGACASIESERRHHCAETVRTFTRAVPSAT